MKKVFVLSAMAVVISLGFTSCKKCEYCNKDSEPEVRICEKDYNSKTEYAITVDGYEAIGYNCR